MRTPPCGPKVFLLLRALASLSTSAVVRARALGRCSATHCWWQHCPSTQLKVFRRHGQQQPPDIDQLSDVGRATYTGSRRIHRRYGGGPPNVDFTSTRTRVNSGSCVNDGYCVRPFSVDTSPSTYFPPFPSNSASQYTHDD